MSVTMLEEIIIPVPITKPHFVSFPVQLRRVGIFGMPSSV